MAGALAVLAAAVFVLPLGAALAVRALSPGTGTARAAAVLAGAVLAYAATAGLLALWVARDARRRGAPHRLWAGVVAATHVLGLGLYLGASSLLPPERACDACGGPVEASAGFCPACGARVPV